MNENVTEKMYLLWEIYSISLKNDIDTILINWRGNDSEALDTSIGYAKNTLVNLLNTLYDIERDMENGDE